MVKHTQTIRPQKPTNCLSVFDHFAGLALKGLNSIVPFDIQKDLINFLDCRLLHNDQR